MRRATRTLAVALALGTAGCGLWRGDEGARGDPRYGVEVVEFEGIADFHARARAFYDRLASRRVNTYATYKDRVLREYFRTEQEFADYYADLADDLATGWFEQNRPLEVHVAEFVFDAPGRARVTVHLVGENGLPLRPGTTRLEREDHWERRDGRWWIVPAKL